MQGIGEGWRRAAGYVALAWVAWAVVLMIAIGGLDAFVLIFAAVPLIAWGLTLWKPGRATYTIFGVIGALVILLNLPFIIEDLAHPESAFGFNTTTWPLLTSIVMVTVGVAAWRPLAQRSSTVLVWGALTVFGLGLVASLVAALSLEDDVVQAGDVELIAEKVEWAPEEVSTPSGSVAVFVSNEDPVRHTFTIDQLDVNLELPAGTDRRIAFDAPSGTYEFYCSVPGHDGMRGTITIGA